MRINKILWSLTVLLVGLNSQVSVAKSSDDDNDETLVVEATAEQVLKQQPGVSVITSEDIKKTPPVNDLSDIIRKMPGVNLTGNSASGTRGNNRQIDIRGMGPENTLILIDGVPVTSRNSVRYSWRGERDTRGDTNWVPPEQVERIEVIRGPAAARYGSGAAGGVVPPTTGTVRCRYTPISRKVAMRALRVAPISALVGLWLVMLLPRVCMVT